MKLGTDRDDAATADDEAAVARTRTDRGERLALGLFVLLLAGAFFYYVSVGNDYGYWFAGDDLGLLVSYDGASLDDLFHEVHDHWSTVPIIIFRVLFNIFGLRYLPYLVAVVSLHVTVAALLRVVMRRAGVGPWIATAVAGMFLLVGVSGWHDILWAYQVGFNASLVLGLAHLVLADHDGPFDRRDAAGLVCGLGALMSSGVGLAMIATVGIAVLIRRGWRLALLHAAPLGAVYLAWYFALDRRSYRDSGGAFDVTTVLRFVARGFSHTLTRDVRFRGGMVVLIAILIVGLALAWTKLSSSELRRRAAMPAAMLFGAVGFLSIVGIGRGIALTTDYATTARFVHVTTALVAPALAVAADAISRRWPIALPVVCIVLLAGVPANLADLRRDRSNGQRELVTALASVPDLETLPRSVRPLTDNYGGGDLTVGWLVDRVRSGQIERSRNVSPDLAAEALRRVALRVEDGSRDVVCRPFRAATRRVEAGDAIEFRGALLVQVATPDGGVSDYGGVAHDQVGRLVALRGPLELRLTPYTPDTAECASGTSRIPG